MMVPDNAYAAALTLLPGMTARRLGALLNDRTGAAAFDLVRSQRLSRDPTVVEVLGRRAREVLEGWRHAATAVDVGGHWRRLQKAGVAVLRDTDADYPAGLHDDETPPPVIFVKGHPSAARGPCVAIVGTRRATRTGRDLAFELGRAAAAAGVAVVSGLALGIDGAAHRGALSVPRSTPVGVVASGLDVVYPPQHGDLWREVGERGLLISEVSVGVHPEKWRFPLRNRLLVALAGVVVVVESHERGGALGTARIAMERSRTLMAVPGSVRSPASSGTNRLLADGATPLLDVDDLLVALALDAPGTVSLAVNDPDLRDDDRVVLDAVGWEPVATDEVLRRTGMGPGPALVCLNRLLDAGLVSNEAGVWERCHRDFA